MAAVDSNYTDPSDSFVWWIEGDKLAIATTKGDGGTAETSEGKFKAASIGSSGDVITSGLLISYYGEPDKITSVSSTIDLDNVLQPALIDFVKAKALMDLAANTEDPNIAQIKMAAGQQAMASYQDAVKRFGSRKRDKLGGTRAIAPFSFK
jgi:hypothetical protein|tara:strand:+ start:271 stop:723 length:453 start_codon:yes stop_codon:yes gene_type:complete